MVPGTGLIFVVSAIAGCGPGLVQAGSAACRDYTKQYDEFDNKKTNGATDADGDGCNFYASNPNECGNHDVKDFIAREMCCSCGGGSTSAVSRSIAVNKASVLLSQGKDCPAGHMPVTTLSACRAALDMVSLSGAEYQGVESDAGWPAGCYYCGKGVDGCVAGVWFNKMTEGVSKQGTQRICHKGYDPASVKILFVGDSDIDYWDSATAFPGSFNVGIGGYQTSDVIKEVDTWVKELDPEWVVIVCGENDINGKRKATQKAVARFKTIVGKFIADGSRVIYMGTKPEPDSKEYYTEYQYYDLEVRKFALSQSQGKSLPPLQMVDVFLSFSSAKTLYNSDNLHMSRLGYTFWNEWVRLAMNSQDPCIRWRDGVCMQTSMGDVRSADLLRRFQLGRLPMAEVGDWKLSDTFALAAFSFVIVVGVSAVVVERTFRRGASVLPQQAEAGLLEETGLREADE